MSERAKHVLSHGVLAVCAGLLASGPAKAADMNCDQFERSVTNWINGHISEMAQASASKGGWEKWLQTEVGIAINTADPLSRFERERRVYKNQNLTADFVTMYALGNGDGRCIVELKVQSAYPSANAGSSSFVAGLQDDAQKLRIDNIQNRQNVRRFSYGVAFHGNPAVPDDWRRILLPNGSGASAGSSSLTINNNANVAANANCSMMAANSSRSSSNSSRSGILTKNVDNGDDPGSSGIVTRNVGTSGKSSSSSSSNSRATLEAELYIREVTN